MASNKCRDGPSLSRYPLAPLRKSSRITFSSRLIDITISFVSEPAWRTRQIASIPPGPAGHRRCRMAASIFAFLTLGSGVGSTASGGEEMRAGNSVYDPFVRGRYPVGVRTFEARDTARDRLFPCEIWYPA